MRIAQQARTSTRMASAVLRPPVDAPRAAPEADAVTVLPVGLEQRPDVALLARRREPGRQQPESSRVRPSSSLPALPVACGASVGFRESSRWHES